MTARRLIIPMLLLATSGCASPRPFLTPAKARLVWPAAPERPRVRYVGEISGPLDASASGDRSGLSEVLFGPDAPLRLVTPYAVAVDPDGDVVAIADTGVACVHVLDLKRNRYRRIDLVDGERLRSPVAVAWRDSYDEILIADSVIPGVFLAKLDGTAATRKPINELVRPAGLVYAGGKVFVSDAGSHRVHTLGLGPENMPQGTFGERGAGTGQLNFPSHLAASPDGTVCVTDSLNARVQRFQGMPPHEPAGLIGRKGDAAGDLSLPKGVAVDPDGHVWVVDAHFENVQAFTSDGRLLMAFGREGHGPGEFWLPAGACIDAKRRLWIADSYNHRVQVFQLLTENEE